VMLIEGVDEEEEGRHCSDVTEQSTCEYARNCKTSLCSPHCIAESMYIHTTCSECNISEPTILLRGRNFCKWLSVSRRLHRYVLFTDVAQFNSGGVSNAHSCNVWCAVLDDQLIGPFVLDGRLTGEAYLRFLQEELLVCARGRQLQR
jgi:hypothetical protein